MDPNSTIFERFSSTQSFNLLKMEYFCNFYDIIYKLSDIILQKDLRKKPKVKIQRKRI